MILQTVCRSIIFFVRTVFKVAIFTIPYSSLSSHTSRTISAPLFLAIFGHVSFKILVKTIWKLLCYYFSMEKEFKSFLIISIPEIIFHLVTWKFTDKETSIFFGEETVFSLFLYLHNGVDVFNVECYISHAVPMSGKMI